MHASEKITNKKNVKWKKIITRNNKKSTQSPTRDVAGHLLFL